MKEKNEKEKKNYFRKRQSSKPEANDDSHWSRSTFENESSSSPQRYEYRAMA